MTLGDIATYCSIAFAAATVHKRRAPSGCHLWTAPALHMVHSPCYSILQRFANVVGNAGSRWQSGPGGGLGVERAAAGGEREGVEAAGREAVMERMEAELALGRTQLVKERAQLARAEGGREAQFARDREEVEGRRRDVERRGEERLEVARGEDKRLSGGETVGKTVWLSFLIASGRRRFFSVFSADRALGLSTRLEPGPCHFTQASGDLGQTSVQPHRDLLSLLRPLLKLLVLLITHTQSRFWTSAFIGYLRHAL
jgi:hypothetical protein